jgi:hypothetical protein
MKIFTTCFGAALLLILGLNACKKSDDAKPAETPITSFLTSTSSVTTGTRSSGPWELGIVFSPSAAGRITQVGSRMPDAGTYRVILWDFDTKAILRQINIDQTAPNTLAMANVESLTMTVNKKYLISINSQVGGTNKRYGYSYKKGGGEFMPFTQGSILVQNACYSGVATATFPNSVPNEKLEFYGFPEFTFVPD